MNYDETHKGISNVVWGVIGQIISLILGIIIPRFILLKYGSEMNGFLNSIVQIFSYMTLLEVGVGGATLQALYKPVAIKNRKDINAILSATAIYYHKAGMIYFIVLILFSIGYPILVDSEISKLTMFTIIICNGISNCFGFFVQNKFKILLQAEGKNYIIANITTITTAIGTIFKIILILEGYSIVLVQFIFCFISSTQAICYYIYQKRKYSWINYKEAPNYSAISQKNSVMVQQVSTLIFNNIDVLLLTFIVQDLKIISIYTMYNLVIYMVKSLLNQLLESFVFKLGQLYQIDRKKYLEYHHIFEIFNFIILFSAMIVLNYCMIPFVKLYTIGVDDINYIDYKLLILFIFIQLLDIGRVSSRNIINFAGHFKRTQRRCLIEAGMNIVFSIIGVYFYGIYGVLLGTIISLLYRTNDMILYTYKYLLKQNPIITYKRWIVCVLVFLFILYEFKWDRYAIESFGQIIIVGIAIGIFSICIYSFIFFICDYKICRKIFNIIKKE